MYGCLCFFDRVLFCFALLFDLYNLTALDLIYVNYVWNFFFFFEIGYAFHRTLAMFGW